VNKLNCEFVQLMPDSAPQADGLSQLHLTVLCMVMFIQWPMLYLCMTIGMTIFFSWPLYILFILHGSKVCLHH